VTRAAAAVPLMAAALLAGCSLGEASLARQEPRAESNGGPALAAVLAGPWRPDAERAQDAWRRPDATLRFLGLGPRQTVVEVWPGAGQYARILAPYAARTGGRYYAAHHPGETTGPEGEALARRFHDEIAARPGLYGHVREGRFGSGAGGLGVPAGRADLVVFPERLHHWMAAGLAEAAFAEAYAALKPGGRLGVIQRRAPSGGVQDPIARDGAVQEAFVTALAGEAGFVADAAPVLHQPPAWDPDRHDLMVLRFRKPPSAGTVLRTQPRAAAPGATS